jgi:hypothetical protein
VSKNSQLWLAFWRLASSRAYLGYVLTRHWPPRGQLGHGRECSRTARRAGVTELCVGEHGQRRAFHPLGIRTFVRSGSVLAYRILASPYQDPVHSGHSSASCRPLYASCCHPAVICSIATVPRKMAALISHRGGLNGTPEFDGSTAQQNKTPPGARTGGVFVVNGSSARGRGDGRGRDHLPPRRAFRRRPSRSWWM